MSNAITLTMGETHSYIEDEIVKTVQKVGIDVNKEKLLDALRASDFVDDLINHLFLFYSADEYISVKTILALLEKNDFVELIDNDYYRRKDNERIRR